VNRASLLSGFTTAILCRASCLHAASIWIVTGLAGTKVMATSTTMNSPVSWLVKVTRTWAVHSW